MLINEELNGRLNQRVTALHGVNEDLRALTCKLMLSGYRERRSIANHLHDDIAMGLLCCNIKLKLLQENHGGDKQLCRSLSQIQEQISLLIGNTRQIIVEVSPISLYELGLEAAVTDLLEDIRSKYGISTNFDYDGSNYPLDISLKVILYQAVREILLNSVRHAFAENIDVCIQVGEEQLEAVIEDDGIGFDYVDFISHGKQDSKMGLLSVQQWLRHIGGYFEIESQPGQGTRAVIIAPFKPRGTLPPLPQDGNSPPVLP